MKRLTEKDMAGNWRLKGVTWEKLMTGAVISEELRQRIYGALFKLKDYEDTGLSPEEVVEFNDFVKSNIARLMKELKKEQRKKRWIPISEQLPDPEEHVLLSFENFSETMIGRYTVDDEDEGTFRVGDCDVSFIEYKLLVNAWMALPECYGADGE